MRIIYQLLIIISYYFYYHYLFSVFRMLVWITTIVETHWGECTGQIWNCFSLPKIYVGFWAT